jgi:hypothetical protein
MKKTLLIGLILVMAIFSAGNSADAFSIGIDPANKIAVVGIPFSISISVSGLGDGVAPSLGAFDLNVLFNPAIISFTGATFGDPGLGDQLDLLGFGSSSGSTIISGGVNLFELSLDPADYLDANQASSFVLASLNFDAIDLGTSAIQLQFNEFGDSGHTGEVLSLLDQLVYEGDGSVTVNPIPEPATLALLSSGLFGLIGLRRRFTKN